MTWRRKGNPDEWHAYGYGFDNAARLIEADYTQNTSGNWTNDVADYKVSIPVYDENGNIKKMKQDGMLLGNVKSGIDDMTYFNENGEYSNRLDGVTDQQGDKQQGDFIRSRHQLFLNATCLLSPKTLTSFQPRINSMIIVA